MTVEVRAGEIIIISYCMAWSKGGSKEMEEGIVLERKKEGRKEGRKEGSLVMFYVLYCFVLLLRRQREST